MCGLLDLFIRQYYKFIAIPLAQRKLKDIHIMNSIDSIQYIIDKKCSVSRFGDGEFFVLMGGGNSFQEPDLMLSKRLKDVLTKVDAPNHIVGLPVPMKSTKGIYKHGKDFWSFFTLRYVDTLLPYLSSKRRYVDTQLSRFYVIYEDRSKCGNQLALLKKIWDDRDVLIVEGNKSCTGVGNDLYDNAKSLQRILGPATNAFSMYNEMYSAIKKYARKDQLILLSYGMTATVLAYDLAKDGYWAIDIGHLDLEYEWFKLGVDDVTAIKGKFTNEAKTQGGHDVEDCYDPKYLSQIVCDITK